MTLSLSIVDTRDYDLAHATIIHTVSVMAQACLPQKIYWYSDQPPDLASINVPLQWIKIKPIAAMPQDYNDVMLELMPSVATEDFNLVIQTDGYPCNPLAWTEEFFDYDYIGAVWPWENPSVGNGGFSLRSRRLLDALLALDLREWQCHPEDATICRHARQCLETEYNIRFAPPELADRFSIEWNISSSWLGRSFGFHGKHSGVQEKYPRLTQHTKVV